MGIEPRQSTTYVNANRNIANILLFRDLWQIKLRIIKKQLSSTHNNLVRKSDEVPAKYCKILDESEDFHRPSSLVSSAIQLTPCRESAVRGGKYSLSLNESYEHARRVKYGPTFKITTQAACE